MAQTRLDGASGFFAMDVLVSSLVGVMLLRTEAGGIPIRRRWAPVVALLTVGASLALPIHRYRLELGLERGPGPNAR